MNVFKRLLMLSGGGTSVPYDYPDKFAFFATSAVVEPSVLEVLRPDDRLGDFTVVRASDASYTDSSGVIQTAPDNTARIDYTNGVAELLTEPQSTNLIEYSEDFSSTGDWLNGGDRLDISTSENLSPEGLLNATKCNSNTDGGSYIYYPSVITSGAEYNVSMFCKKINVDVVKIRDFTQGGSIEFNLSTISIGVTSGTLSDGKMEELSNGWIRCSAKLTPISDGSVNIGFLDMPLANDSCDIWGAQLEELPYATSYIPTNGSTVTRLQDQITDGANVNVINSEEGTMFFEGSYYVDGFDKHITISDGTDVNRIVLTLRDASMAYGVEVGGAPQFVTLLPDNVNKVLKFAATWKTNDCRVFINGIEEATDSLSTMFGAGVLNTVNLSNNAATEQFFGRTRELKIYDRALTEEELENITKQDLVINPTL